MYYKVIFLNTFPKYNIIKLYNTIPKHIQEENSIILFHTKYKNYQITNKA